MCLEAPMSHVVTVASPPNVSPTPGVISGAAQHLHKLGLVRTCIEKCRRRKRLHKQGQSCTVCHCGLVAAGPNRDDIIA